MDIKTSITIGKIIFDVFILIKIYFFLAGAFVTPILEKLYHIITSLSPVGDANLTIVFGSEHSPKPIPKVKACNLTVGLKGALAIVNS